MYVYVLLYVEYVLSQAPKTIKKSGALLLQKQPFSLAATKTSVYSSTAAVIQRQPCSKLSPLCLCSFFSFFCSFHLLCSHFLPLFSLLGHNSDPGPLSRLFSPLPTTVRAFVFIARSLQSFLPSSTRIDFSASGHGVCVWPVHSNRRSNHSNTSTSNATIKPTSSNLIPGIRSIQQQQKQNCSSYLYISLERLCSPFYLLALQRPRDITSGLSRRGTLYAA